MGAHPRTPEAGRTVEYTVRALLLGLAQGFGIGIIVGIIVAANIYLAALERSTRQGIQQQFGQAQDHSHGPICQVVIPKPQGCP